MLWNENVLLRDLKKTLAEVWSVNDKNDWPVRFNTISHLFAQEFYMDLRAALDNLTLRNYSSYDMGMLFGGPSMIFRCFDLVLRGMYLKKLPAAEKRQFLTKLLQCAQAIKHGSIFNEDGANRILDDEGLKTLAGGGYWKLADRKASLAVHQLIGLVKAYTEILYFRIYDISQEIHGPYSIDGNTSILVREFHNLVPEGLWSEFRFVDFRSLCICTEYDAAVKVRIDPYNHMFQEGEGFVAHLNKWRITADGRETEDADDVFKLIEQIGDAIRYNAEIIANYDWRLHTSRYAQICWYKIKKLLEVAEISASAYNQAVLKILDGIPQEQSERFFQGDRINLLLNLLI